jgi:hypothetical protein
MEEHFIDPERSEILSVFLIFKVFSSTMQIALFWAKIAGNQIFHYTPAYTTLRESSSVKLRRQTLESPAGPFHSILGFAQNVCRRVTTNQLSLFFIENDHPSYFIHL